MWLRTGLIVLALWLMESRYRFAISAAEPAKKAPAQAGKTVEKITFAKHVSPVLNRYCVSCHGGKKPKADLALDLYRSEADALKVRDIWEKVAERLRAHEMPPAKRPQPNPTDVEVVTAWIESALGSGDCIRRSNPGRVTIRRLNRTEYNNTIRDLVGVDFHPADDFPADDIGYGFDNIGDVLSLPPVLLEKYLAAAEKIVAAALAKPELRQRISFRRPDAKFSKAECARTVLENFARRAYRRPVNAEEVGRLAGFVRLAESHGDSYDKGIELALEAVLTSPYFLFRVERDPKPEQGKATHRISEYELASRLSYFLWSTMPDEELFRQAQQEALRTAENLERQVRRMLQDAKSRALVENFAGQWLQTRNLKTVTPDPDRFLDFDESLRSAMRQETEMFFGAVLREDRSILDFLDAPFTFVNERLARHYKIPGVQGAQFRRVSLSGEHRGGILTQASVLTVTSNPTRTSPVKRGKWILENILGTPPPPPPPGAGQLSEDKAVVLSGSLRQRMEQHRVNPNCASCHERMDPLGFGLENFDAIGAWRDRDGAFAIDSSGTLPGGRSFAGPAELRAILKNQREAFSRCLTEKMLTYALGRGLETYDRCAVDQICSALARNEFKFSTLVIEIAKSDPFQKRRNKEEQR